jgi:hypothetical protein
MRTYVRVSAEPSPTARLIRSLAAEDLFEAEVAAREIQRGGQLGLDVALELTMLISRKDPHRFDRAAGRWLRRVLEEKPLGLSAIGGLAAELQAVGAGVSPEGLVEACEEAGLTGCARAVRRGRQMRLSS